MPTGIPILLAPSRQSGCRHRQTQGLESSHGYGLAEHGLCLAVLKYFHQVKNNSFHIKNANWNLSKDMFDLS